MTDLSPAAQAIIDASNCAGSRIVQLHIVDAMRAAADQVVPKGPKPSANSDYHLMNWTKSLDQYYQRQATRDQLLTIAAELEALDD